MTQQGALLSFDLFH